MRLEDLRQHVVRNPDAVVTDDDLDATIGEYDVDVDVSRMSEARVLEHVQQHFAELINARDRDSAVVGAGYAPLDLAFPHALQVYHVAHDLRDIDRRARGTFGGSRPVPTE